MSNRDVNATKLTFNAKSTSIETKDLFHSSPSHE